MRNYYVSGDWNALCDRCGFKFKASMLRKEWTGLRVCSCCYETRHPQDLLRVEPEKINVPWSRPEPADVFVSDLDPWMTEDGDTIYAQPVELPLYT